MQKLNRMESHNEALQRLVRSVTFFKDIARIAPDQFELLISVSEFIKADAGETVLQKGNQDQIMYFLLKGQMSVYSEDGESLNLINPGEVFGALSMLTGRGRSATVKAETEVTLLGMDFKYFKDIENFGMLTLQTKLVAYRMMLHNIRWNLELNKMQFPDHPLNLKLLKIKPYNGEKGTVEELQALHAQAGLLAELLCEWNDEYKLFRADQLTTTSL